MRIGTSVLLDEPEIDEFSEIEEVKLPIPKSNNVKKTFFGLPPKAKAEDCEPVSTFPYMEFSFEYFNPPQTTFIKQGIESTDNVVVSANMSSGKTVVAETVIAHTLEKVRREHPTAKAVYVSPLRALCSEKYQTWTSNHSFAKYSISILTGDYVLTKEKKEELLKADIICMSSEMLGSRIRRETSEHNVWLTRDTMVLVNDESHLISDATRGPNAEVALMKFTKVNPKCRIIFLSGTMPNAKNLSEWLTVLNNKKTILIESDYRPVDLFTHYEYYSSCRNYKMNEEVKRVAAMDIINKHREDKFLVFVHTKKTGYILQESLKQRGIITEFHNADVSKDERERIEREFRSRDPQSLRVIIATSTLAMGLNLPARRVILVGLSRGMNLITSMEINQMIGRAGRIGLDIQGDAHILIDNTNAVEEIGLCKKIEPVTSKLGERKIFGFHIISEIAEKNIATIDDAVEWYLRSLLHHQSIFELEGQARRFIIETFDELEKYGAIKKSPTGYSATKIGLVASWYYLSPYDVTGWANNFKNIMLGNFTSEDIAWALSNIDSCMSDYELRLNDPLYTKLEYALQQRGRQMVGGVGKKAFAYYCILKNLDAEQREMHSIMAGTYGDMERISSAIKTLGNVSKMFEDCPNKHLLLELPYRLRYRTENVELVLIPGVGSVTARKMMGRRIFNCKELLMAQEMGQKILTDEKWAKVKDTVKKIANIGYLNYLKYQDKSITSA